MVVVLLTGGRPAIGPLAAGIGGDIYRRLNQQNYFATSRPTIPMAILSGLDLLRPPGAGPYAAPPLTSLKQRNISR